MHAWTFDIKQNDQHFQNDIFKCIFSNENIWISINISLKFVLKCPINNIPALVQIMVWRRLGDKSLSESLMVRWRVTRAQWVKKLPYEQWHHHTIEALWFSVPQSHFCGTISYYDMITQALITCWHKPNGGWTEDPDFPQHTLPRLKLLRERRHCVRVALNKSQEGNMPCFIKNYA